MFSDPGFLNDFFRSIFTALDNFGYFFVDGIFSIFFTIVNADIFSGVVINKFYERVQLILSVLMIFKLSITLLQIIVNPDMFKDKQKGAGSIVKRIAVMLILLSLIVPINIPSGSNNTALNTQISNNGILFGFLYQFQNSVIQDNILGKLILGSNVESISSDEGSEIGNISDIGPVISSTVAKAFIKPTLKAGASAEINSEKDYEKKVACPSENEAMPYFNSELTSSTLINHINDTCKDVESDEEVYVFDYTILGGLICSIIMTIIILGFTVDIAVRAVKLAVLRLIAPVPIISYISPGSEKDGAFGNWVKTLASTYLSLFIRLAIIYFGAYLIMIISSDGIKIWQSSPSFVTSLLATIFIIIGILVFMKEAPKFFQDMLGIKGDGKLFSGIGTVLGAAALTGGLAGSVAANYRAARDEVLEDGGSTRKARMMGALSGGVGAIGGLFAGGKALATSDKKVPSSVMAAMQKRNAMRASHSTLPGRISSGAYGMLTGRTLAESDQQILDLNKEAASQAKALKGLEEEEALKYGDYGTVTVSDGFNDYTGNFNYEELVAAMNGKDANGNFSYDGTDYNVSMFNKNVMEEIKKQQTIRYTQGHVAAGVDANNTYENNGKIRSQKRQTDYAFRQAGGEAAKKYGNGDYNNLGKAIGAANDAVTEMSTNMKNIKHRANHNANKNG